MHRELITNLCDNVENVTNEAPLLVLDDGGTLIR